MFKRVRWMGMGAVAGAGASLWAKHRLTQTFDEHPSIRRSAQAALKAKAVGTELRGALVDGREAMAEREAVLRTEVDRRFVSLGPDERRHPAEAYGHPSGERPRLHVVETRSMERAESLGDPLPIEASLGTRPGLRSHPSLGEPGRDETARRGPDRRLGAAANAEAHGPDARGVDSGLDASDLDRRDGVPPTEPPGPSHRKWRRRRSGR